MLALQLVYNAKSPMDTLQEARHDGGTAPPRAVGGTHRHRRRLIWAGLIATIVAVAAAFAYAARYQPIYVDEWGVQSAAVTSRSDVSSPSGEDFTYYNITYQHGTSFTYQFEIVNRGPLGITITGVDSAPEWRTLGLLRIVRIGMNLDPSAAETFVPFEPFSLPAHGSRRIQAQAVFAGCARYAPQTGTVYHRQSIDYRVLGIPHRRFIDVNMVFNVETPGTPGYCPEPGAVG
jgi:hypothetical protein